MRLALRDSILLSENGEHLLYVSCNMYGFCRRARAAYAAWSEQWIADMKLQKPGLRQQQYKDLCWKAWQRSPDNPMNQIKPPT